MFSIWSDFEVKTRSFFGFSAFIKLRSVSILSLLSEKIAQCEICFLRTFSIGSATKRIAFSFSSFKIPFLAFWRISRVYLLTVAEFPISWTDFGRRSIRPFVLSLSSGLKSRSASSRTRVSIPSALSFFKWISSRSRAGPPITISGFSFKSSICREIGAPPISRAHFIPLIFCTWTFIWEASS